jgi:hypothetical protein
MRVADRETPAAGEGSLRDALRELERLAGSPAALSVLLGADKRTVARWLAGEHLSRLGHVERLMELKAILDLARRAHGRHALAWFKTPNSHIRHIQPGTLLADAGGRAVVQDLLAGAVMGGVA